MDEAWRRVKFNHLKGANAAQGERNPQRLIDGGPRRSFAADDVFSSSALPTSRHRKIVFDLRDTPEHIITAAPAVIRFRGPPDIGSFRDHLRMPGGHLRPSVGGSCHILAARKQRAYLTNLLTCVSSCMVLFLLGSHYPCQQYNFRRDILHTGHRFLATNCSADRALSRLARRVQKNARIFSFEWTQAAMGRPHR